ncbi:MAG: tetratricopeptide repeat protein [Zetaproteobacteria bacterium]|nr:MAG: tetratricopeptide repeat protein [Zetaproteobacteria bacterium]
MKRLNVYLLLIGWFVLALLSACVSSPMRPTADLAMDAWKQGDLTQARRLLEKAVRQHPENLQARYNLAWLLEEQGHEDDAAALYEENLQHGMHLPSVINLAVHYQRHGAIDKAIQLLERACVALPHEATPRYVLAQLMHQTGDEKAAEHYFQEALQADVNNPLAHIFYARWLASRDMIDPAIREARQATKLAPTCAVCWRILGDVLMRHRRARRAIEAYQRSLAIEPDTKTRQQLIAALQAAGEKERAQRMHEALEAASGKGKSEHP